MRTSRILQGEVDSDDDWVDVPLKKALDKLRSWLVNNVVQLRL